MRRFITPVPATLVTALIVAFGVRAGAQLPGFEKLNPLMQQAVTNPGGQSRVIVRADNSASLPLVRALIQQYGGSPGRQLPIIDAQAADIPNAILPALAASAVITRIVSDRPTIATNERTGQTVGAVAVRQELGYDGSGVGVAVIDSGRRRVARRSRRRVAARSASTQFVDFVNGAADAVRRLRPRHARRRHHRRQRLDSSGARAGHRARRAPRRR